MMHNSRVWYGWFLKKCSAENSLKPHNKKKRKKWFNTCNYFFIMKFIFHIFCVLLGNSSNNRSYQHEAEDFVVKMFKAHKDFTVKRSSALMFHIVDDILLFSFSNVLVIAEFFCYSRYFLPEWMVLLLFDTTASWDIWCEKGFNTA